jgi:hypothetical protein
MKDLVLLVADKNMQFALKGILGRPQSIGIRSIDFEFRPHMGRDGGVRTSGPEVLALERGRFSHGLLVFDLEGSGADTENAVALEQELDATIALHWEKRGKAIVIDPEVDAWMWGADNALREVLEWPLEGAIRDWLQAKGFEFLPNDKPVRPKEALEALVPVHRQPRSSALYEQITSKISLKRCQDAAFLRLRAQLQMWFPIE